MINLNFEVFSFYYPNNNERQKYKKYVVYREYDKNLTLYDVLLDLHSKYKIDNGMYENYFIPHINELMWKQYFSKDICNMIDNSESEYYKLTLAEIEKQFNISSMVIPVYLNLDGIGKAIGIKEGVKFFFHFNEKDLHHKPHVHCEYSGHETRIEIKTLKVLDKPFKKSKMKVAFEFIEKNREELLNYWERTIINGESVELYVVI